MLAGMMSYYGELNDYEAPLMRDTPERPRNSPVERKSRASEMSMDLDDLEDLRETNNNNLSTDISLSGWQNEADTTSGFLGAGFLRYPSLDDVLEHNHDDSDDEDYPSRARLTYLDNSAENIRHRNDELSSSSLTQQGNNSNAVDGLYESFPGFKSGGVGCVNDDDNYSKGSGLGKKVHFEVPARLEDIQEFEKPDAEDYSNLYYMAHEIQKMMDDFRVESQLDRHVLR
mmetsp:Transcript_881/g.1606  ORF Transcript_881/g.1606 Transcript_881/m.1606 type:complete len:229 (-) Transcript_881:182-868(-)